MTAIDTNITKRAAVSAEVAREKISYYANRLAKRPVKSVQAEKEDIETFNASLVSILSNPSGGGVYDRSLWRQRGQGLCGGHRDRAGPEQGV